MTIYEKLQICRVELQKMSLKKSGKNKFAGFSYYELADFLPQINELMLKYKLCSRVTFEANVAELTIVNAETVIDGIPQEIICFYTPSVNLELKGCNAIQSLGAVQTYLRRYLYMNAFEIVEHDALDAQPLSEPKEDKPAPAKVSEITDQQIKRLYAVAKDGNITPEKAKEWVKAKFKKDSIKDLTVVEYNLLIKALESQKVKEVKS